MSPKDVDDNWTGEHGNNTVMTLGLLIQALTMTAKQSKLAMMNNLL